MKQKAAQILSIIAFTTFSLLPTGTDKFAFSSVHSLSEATPLDVILVIDASDSMTYDAESHDSMRDPSQCNLVHNCQPFEYIKNASQSFVDQLSSPDDRVAVVTFDNDARVDLGFSAERATILAAIDELEVIEPAICDTVVGPCRLYERDPVTQVPTDLNSDGLIEYYGFNCPVYQLTGDPSTCPTTAIGQGLLIAGNEFGKESSFREESLKVIILVTDGAANAPSFVCPNHTWEISPFCRDQSPTSRHCLEENDLLCLAAGGIFWPERYDADDYARDMADFVANDQRALIFTIGLGNLVRTSEPRTLITDPAVKCASYEPVENCLGAGEQLMQYAAAVGSGKYYFAADGQQLDDIFLDIFNRISSILPLTTVTKVDDTDDGVCDSDCSLREAISVASSGATITFDLSLAGQILALSSTITIDKNLTIDGSNLISHVQISGDTNRDGTGNISVFRIAAGKTVEITDLEIVGGSYTDWLTAGGINNDGNLTVRNCSFSGNAGDQGGAIHNKGSLTISNCSFAKNTAVEGGAIFNDLDSNAVIAASAFFNNTAAGEEIGSAGAIGNIGTILVTDSDFFDNSAEFGGGALVNSFLGLATIERSSFTENIVQGSTFTGGSSPPGFGGAIYNVSGNLLVKESTFSGNSAEGGAAINAGNRDPYTEEESTVMIENSVFSENSASVVAGGVHVFSGMVRVEASTFKGNSAERGRWHRSYGGQTRVD